MIYCTDTHRELCKKHLYICLLMQSSNKPVMCQQCNTLTYAYIDLQLRVNGGNDF